jgi:formylglycine-generating enzyme required for sulfatase activity/serine/threonine protein kinase
MSGRDPLNLVGVTIADKYRVLDLAGEGGFSAVYRAEHLIWKQPVALKVFTVLESAETELRERLLADFIQEGKLMSELSSRSAAIVQARDIGKLSLPDGAWIPYMVLEWLDGTPLDVVVGYERRRQLPPRRLAEAVQLLDPVASALELAHRQGVAHRDLKPANIMIMGDARDGGTAVKVLDFGIAKVMAEHQALQEQLQLTGQQVTAFTPNYGAPEQFSRNYGATGPWTDVYAMALILIEVMRGGERALAGGTFFELGVSSCDPQRRPTPRAFGLELPPGAEEVFQRAVSVNPRDRFPAMGELWRALYQVVFPGTEWRASSGRGVPTGQMTAMSPSSGPFASRPAPSVSSQPGAMRSPTDAGVSSKPVPVPTSKVGVVVVGVVGAAALGVGLLAVMMARGGSDPTAAASAAPSASATAAAPASSLARGARIEWDGPCPKGMKLVTGGKFRMGSDDPSFPLWKPAHDVTIDSACLDVTEVTVAAFRDCVRAGACPPAAERPSFPKPGSLKEEDHEKQLVVFAELCNWDKPGRDEHPVNCVDWTSADAYCKHRGFRLPTEAEWELAARGRDGRVFPWGNDTGDHTYMNAAGREWRRWLEDHGLPRPTSLMYEADDGFAGTSPVGRFPRAMTQSGQLDMVGNVWEWTSDWYALYKPDDQVNPKGPSAGDRKAIRGGGFNGEVATWVNPAARYFQVVDARHYAIGFRCASDVKPAD